MNLVNSKIAGAVQRLGAVNHGTQQVVFFLAVSGGPDSQCLLKAFPHVARKQMPTVRIVALGVNHGLRPEADAELDLAKELAASQGVQFIRLRVNVPKQGASTQAKARKARYDAMFDEMLIAAPPHSQTFTFPVRYLVTAHHFDDRAETVLIRLLRGKRVGSLGVLPEVTRMNVGMDANFVFRPMLKVSRTEIEAYLKRWKVPFATDPSNACPKYLRSKVRHELLPQMEKLSPRIRERLNDLADEVLGQG